MGQDKNRSRLLSTSFIGEGSISYYETDNIIRVRVGKFSYPVGLGKIRGRYKLNSIGYLFYTKYPGHDTCIFYIKGVKMPIMYKEAMNVGTTK